MAAASIQPSPRTLMSMTDRRVPLASNSNAVNSPFRGLAPISGKRTRAQTEVVRETIQGQPPNKRLVLEHDRDENAAARTITRPSQTLKEAEQKFSSKRHVGRTPTSLEAKLLAARGSKSQHTQQQPAEVSPETTRKTAESLDNIRQWQRHYRKAFPNFVFFLDNVPAEVHRRISVYLKHLHAREEKFFSRVVTHVVTTRSIPPAKNDLSSKDAGASQNNGDGHSRKTIDPSLLSRDHGSGLSAAQKRTTDLLDANIHARAGVADNRRQTDQSMSILHKAREWDQKIWSLEKLQRMLMTLYTNESGEVAPPLIRSHATANLAERQDKEADLEVMLRNEKISGPADRDPTVAAADQIQLRGYYIYVHDMDERTRPTMVRDYPKPQQKENGKWPQLRVSSIGRCPWMEDPSYAKRALLEQKRKETAKEDEANPSAGAKSRVTEQDNDHPVLSERPANLRRSPRKLAPEGRTKPLDPPRVPTSRKSSVATTDGMPPLFNSAQAMKRGTTRYIGGEPVASGVQPSNITSAIRSQAISSTTISSTAPGARVGTSRELQTLKRKVLERGANVTSGSSYMNDVRAALNGDGAHGAKRKAGVVLDDIGEEDEHVPQPHGGRKAQPPRQVKKVVLKDPKPGYCENCRDKFDDFDEHVKSRKHRKFALDPNNWTELDKLLDQLKRPRKAT